MSFPHTFDVGKKVFFSVFSGAIGIKMYANVCCGARKSFSAGLWREGGLWSLEHFRFLPRNPQNLGQPEAKIDQKSSFSTLKTSQIALKPSKTDFTRDLT